MIATWTLDAPGVAPPRAVPPSNGCSIEVYVRAADYRSELGSGVFLPVTNNVPFATVRGRFTEVRLGMMRDNPAKQPVLYELTLYGVSSGFIGDYFLYDEWADGALTRSSRSMSLAQSR